MLFAIEKEGKNKRNKKKEKLMGVISLSTWEVDMLSSSEI